MTEQEWLSCQTPNQMLRFLGEKASDRKLRLFGALCCRGMDDCGGDGIALRAIAVAERLADGLADSQEVREARTATETIASGRLLRVAAGHLCHLEMFRSISQLLHYLLQDLTDIALRCDSRDWDRKKSIEWVKKRRDIERIQGPVWSDLIREMVGNPYRPISIPPAWVRSNGETVLKLAEATYQDQQFARMPILADALEDAGCTDATILEHLRGPGPHVRGCWALDLLLDKK